MINYVLNFTAISFSMYKIKIKEFVRKLSSFLFYFLRNLFLIIFRVKNTHSTAALEMVRTSNKCNNYINKLTKQMSFWSLLDNYAEIHNAHNSVLRISNATNHVLPPHNATKWYLYLTLLTCSQIFGLGVCEVSVTLTLDPSSSTA